MSENIQMKAILKQYFPMVLFITLCKVILTVDFVDVIKMKAFERHFPDFSQQNLMFCKIVCCSLRR